VTEGFVSISAFAAVTRRAGAMAARLFALLQGTETPADIAAIMAWFAEDPSRMSNWAIEAGGADEGIAHQPDRRILVSQLGSEYVGMSGAAGSPDDSAARSWSRFMSQIWSTIRERRGPADRGGGSDADEDAESPEQQVANEREKNLCLDKFEDFFEALLKKDSTEMPLMAFDLAQFVGSRVNANASRVQRWIRRLSDRACRADIPPNRKEAIAAAVLLVDDGRPSSRARNARGRLRRLSFELSGSGPSVGLVGGLLFNKKVLLNALKGEREKGVELPKPAIAAMRHWIDQLGRGLLNKLSESSAEQSFNNEIFGTVLGYEQIGQAVEASLMPKRTGPQRQRYAGLRSWSFDLTAGLEDWVAVGEIKDAKTDLDQPQIGRLNRETPVEQGFRYASKGRPGVEWIILEAACWAHGRRKFFILADIEAAARSKAKGEKPAMVSPLALEAVRRIDALFEIERAINGKPPEERLAVRQEHSAPLVADLEAWMRSSRAKLSSKSKVAEAMDYMLKRWAAFARFLEDGRICLTNNAAERALRGIALGRKSWLFAGSDRGGQRAAVMYSLIVSAKMNDVDPQAWLADVLAHIADHPASKLDELLPWNWRRFDARADAA